MSLGLPTIKSGQCFHRNHVDNTQLLSPTVDVPADPASGAFTERVQRLLRQDGELATVIGQQVEAERANGRS